MTSTTELFKADARGRARPRVRAEHNSAAERVYGTEALPCFARVLRVGFSPFSFLFFSLSLPPVRRKSKCARPPFIPALSLSKRDSYAFSFPPFLPLCLSPSVLSLACRSRSPFASSFSPRPICSALYLFFLRVRPACSSTRKRRKLFYTRAPSPGAPAARRLTCHVA